MQLYVSGQQTVKISPKEEFLVFLLGPWGARLISFDIWSLCFDRGQLNPQNQSNRADVLTLGTVFLMAQQTAVIKNSGIRIGGFKSQLNHLLDLKPWIR